MRVLRFGPFFTEADASRCAEAVGRARFLHAPHLGPPEFERYTKAWLEFEGGQRRELNLGRQETFPTCAVRWDVDGWLVAREPSQPTLLFNNRSRITALLAPGDTVTSGTTRFIFRAS